MEKTKNLDDIKMEFINVGEKIIRLEGIEALTVRRIVSKTGKSNGTFYSCYSDKDELLDDIFNNYTKIMVCKLDECYDNKFDAYTNISSNIRKMINNSKNENRDFVFAYLISALKNLKMDSPLVLMLKKLFDKGVHQKHFIEMDYINISYSIIIFLYASLINYNSNDNIDIEQLNKSIEIYIDMIFERIRINVKKMDLESRLIEAGVDINSGIARFSNNKESYMKFLRDFFFDEDFKYCKEALENNNIEMAFECAHGLKGLAGTLSINNVYIELVNLVEILRGNTLEGAMEVYTKVTEECRNITQILDDKEEWGML